MYRFFQLLINRNGDRNRDGVIEDNKIEEGAVITTIIVIIIVVIIAAVVVLPAVFFDLEVIESEDKGVTAGATSVAGAAGTAGAVSFSGALPILFWDSDATNSKDKGSAPTALTATTTPITIIITTTIFYNPYATKSKDKANNKDNKVIDNDEDDI
ncbi:hypothetical protein TWF718_003270 [Orbilia javanica]|uniref:Uncharacterized protein n=1 Tax=Orbilia javanica TaxID=47235 RepID=A0AAN8R8G5_9PEZI